MVNTSLSAAKRGDRCVVLDIAEKPAELRSRLYALGVIPGSALEVLRYAPPGRPHADQGGWKLCQHPQG